MRGRYVAALAIMVGSIGSFAPAAVAQDDTAADIAFWNSIQADNDPAEFQAYLSAFPNGKFARLAKLRMKPVDDPAVVGTQKPVGAGPFRVQLMPGQANPEPGGKPVAVNPDPVNDDDPLPEQIDVSPSRGRVGQMFSFACTNFPDPSSYDKVVVVPSGTPDMDPTRDPADTKILWWDYARNCKTGPLKGGPFPPGKFEARFITILYNSEHRYEVKARAELTVR